MIRGNFKKCNLIQMIMRKETILKTSLDMEIQFNIIIKIIKAITDSNC